MIHEPMDVLGLYPIRRTKEQKTEFRKAVSLFASRFGYEARTESCKKDVNNLVIGDPEHAKFLVTAHYDTPGASVFPNILIPTNYFVFALYQLAMILGYFLIATVPALLVSFIIHNNRVIFLVWYVTYMFLVFLPRFGPANRNNSNDNTSGVITVLEIMRALPAEARDSVCFVLFDQEEMGLVGSAQYTKLHQEAVKKQIVLNLDCVGDGDILLFTPTKSAREFPDAIAICNAVCGRVGHKELVMCQKTACDASDHKKFPIGIGIKALHRNRWIGLYCGRIHTKRDTVLDTSNIEVLRTTLISLINNNIS